MSGTSIALVLLPVAVLAGWGFVVLHRLGELRKRLRIAWQTVVLHLTRRRGTMPALLAVIEEYAPGEHQLVENLSGLPALERGGGVPEVTESERHFGRALFQLLAAAAEYPRMGEDENFRALQNTLVRLEEDIQAARRGYNTVAHRYNSLRTTFPGTVLARFFKFEAGEFFELEARTEAEMPTVIFNLGCE